MLHINSNLIAMRINWECLNTGTYQSSMQKLRMTGPYIEQMNHYFIANALQMMEKKEIYFAEFMWSTNLQSNKEQPINFHIKRLLP